MTATGPKGGSSPYYALGYARRDYDQESTDQLPESCVGANSCANTFPQNIRPLASE